MTDSPLEILLEFSSLLLLITFLSLMIYQGHLIGHQRYGYTRRDTKKEAATVRSRIERLLRD